MYTLLCNKCVFLVDIGKNQQKTEFFSWKILPGLGRGCYSTTSVVVPLILYIHDRITTLHDRIIPFDHDIKSYNATIILVLITLMMMLFQRFLSFYSQVVFIAIYFLQNMITNKYSRITYEFDE